METLKFTQEPSVAAGGERSFNRKIDGGVSMRGVDKSLLCYLCLVHYNAVRIQFVNSNKSERTLMHSTRKCIWYFEFALSLLIKDLKFYTYRHT